MTHSVPTRRSSDLPSEAGDEVDRRTGGAAATERHKNHVVPDWLAAIPTAMLTDEHAIGEPGTHRRRGEGQAQRGDMRSQAVIRTDRRGDLLRILRPHARFHILAPIAVGPAVESTFTDGCGIVWNQVRAAYGAFVNHCPSLTRHGR